MKGNKILRDKVNQARVNPSNGIWTRIEAGLDKEDRVRSLRRWSVMGWVAAALILVAVYVSGQFSGGNSSYLPQTLELNDQAGEIQVPIDYYPAQQSAVNYRHDGRLVPNFEALWKHPLVPAGKSL